MPLAYGVTYRVSKMELGGSDSPAEKFHSFFEAAALFLSIQSGLTISSSPEPSPP